MNGYGGALLLLALTSAVVMGAYVLGSALSLMGRPLRVRAFSGGVAAREHPVSRFHARWYPMTLVFLAFDLEMLFMYPWALVVASVGIKAVVEMFVFLTLLLVGVVYAWREGAFRWT